MLAYFHERLFWFRVFFPMFRRHWCAALFFVAFEELGCIFPKEYSISYLENTVLWAYLQYIPSLLLLLTGLSSILALIVSCYYSSSVQIE